MYLKAIDNLCITKVITKIKKTYAIILNRKKRKEKKIMHFGFVTIKVAYLNINKGNRY